ncbi:hypothetical protein KBC79_07070 [Candidatus Woesebacteria bacterium]|nr:hypothetical protein [Candidatus Woesebacteria bacterium]
MSSRISPKYVYTSKTFSYLGKQTKSGWQFNCSVPPTTVNTREIPETMNILKKTVPGVFDTECFNDLYLPFVEEAAKTEIGHLFEHIIIHLLFVSQNKNSKPLAVYEGKTSWNWVKNPTGSFSIRIKGPKVTTELFSQLLEKATAIIEQILMSSFHVSRPNTAISLS